MVCEVTKMAIRFNSCTLLRTVRELVNHAASKYGDKPAFKELDSQRNVVVHSFNDLKSDTEGLASALIGAGMRGRHIALIGGNSYNYVVSYLATVNYVGVIVPIDKEMTTDDIIRLLGKCDAEGLFFSDSLSSVIPVILEKCPKITFSVNISAQPQCADYPLLKDMIISGRERMRRGETDFLRIPLDEDKMCTILFTSGTTGANKGVMLCHRNLTASLFGAMSLFKVPPTSFSVLPINHSYEFNIHVLSTIYGGSALCFNSSIKHVKENLKIFQPHMSLMVPMIVKGLYKNIWKEAEKTGLAGHLKYGIFFSNAIRKIGIDNRKVFFFPILDSLGGNLTTIVCGGAPLNADIIKKFDDIGIHVYNGYGITECSPLISSNCPFFNRPGSVGIVIPGCEVRIGDPDARGIGEIQARGRNVMLGYYKDEEATRQTFTQDGWFKTGDLGYLRKGKVLYITGRAKNLIVLSNGKNISPEEVEEDLLDSISYIREVVVYAEHDEDGNENIITAAAYLDEEFVNKVGFEKAKETFEQDVDRLNRRLANYKRISKVLVRETEFEKTTTKKIKRSQIHAGGAKDA